MNIAVYVTSKYNNYEELSKLLDDHIRKVTTSPVLLLTDTGEGNKLVKQYADDHNIQSKIYSTEWGRFGHTAGVIAVYHMLHNSERGICLWNGLSRGCRAFLKMSQRLNRNVDLIRVTISAVNTPTAPQQPEQPTAEQPPMPDAAMTAGATPPTSVGVGGAPMADVGGNMVAATGMASDANGDGIDDTDANLDGIPDAVQSYVDNAGAAAPMAAPTAAPQTVANDVANVQINPNAGNIQLPVTEPPAGAPPQDDAET
jgi:hypothetical protein